MQAQPIPRAAAPLVEHALRLNPVVALIGPRQCGKTTLARQFVAARSPNYFDLEDPLSLARLDEPMTALGPLSGLVVIDEVHRRPALFPVLRVLADREDNPARFLVLGSAGPDLLLFARGRRVGVDIKRVDAPRRTPSMTAALRDLSLDALYVLYPGDLRYEIGDRMFASPPAERFNAVAPA